MEQQQTKLPLEWLSSRRTPELHRLEQLCRETAREHRCAQRKLQEVEEAVAIRWHMGGFDDAVRGGSFAMSGAFEKYPLAVKLHIADLEATYLLEQRGE